MDINTEVIHTAKGKLENFSYSGKAIDFFLLANFIRSCLDVAIVLITCKNNLQGFVFKRF